MSTTSPLPPTTSNTKRRLFAAPKPRHDLPEHPTPEPSRDKNTRDLPNLSECQGCALRIDYSNPKVRLQPLDSFWRILLLCKKCIRQVNSGQNCVYCLKDASKSSISDCFTCPECEHVVHKDCVEKYANSPPWCYNVGKKRSEFTVCVDCWVPASLKRSIRGPRRRRNESENGNGNGNVIGNDNGNGNGSGSGNGNGNGNDSSDKSLNETLKDAKCAMESKVAAAAVAKEKALRKAVEARDAVEVATNAVHFCVKKGVIGSASVGLVRNCEAKGNGAEDVTKVTNDTELAFQLHRQMNSSPRIAKNAGSVNTSSWDLYKKSISARLMEPGRGVDGTVLEAAANVGGKGNGAGAVSGRTGPVVIACKRRNSKRKVYSEEAEAGNLVGEKSSPENVPMTELRVKDSWVFGRSQNSANSQGEGSVNADSGRCFIKYTRKTSSKPPLPKPEEGIGSLGQPANSSVKCTEPSDPQLRSDLLNQQ